MCPASCDLRSRLPGLEHLINLVLKRRGGNPVRFLQILPRHDCRAEREQVRSNLQGAARRGLSRDPGPDSVQHRHRQFDKQQGFEKYRDVIKRISLLHHMQQHFFEPDQPLRPPAHEDRQQRVPPQQTIASKHDQQAKCLDRREAPQHIQLRVRIIVTSIATSP